MAHSSDELFLLASRVATPAAVDGGGGGHGGEPRAGRLASRGARSVSALAMADQPDLTFHSRIAPLSYQRAAPPSPGMRRDLWIRSGCGFPGWCTGAAPPQPMRACGRYQNLVKKYAG
ncbi:hypothetical protein E2562_023867 [Oryza meyeriana var. granulata]|uniref:Uncharacterized protein n=1 Tax=Oryza meyeriana var. granulata TaxID=110450 RepID=A0A6G1D749_9ORYZ|nr:hypothetical protein E2562_023867 [Oryza meyeriana var. granulata]